METAEPRLTILGAGYVGEALWRRFPHAQATRRRPADAGILRFDLAEPETWDAPALDGRHVVWTFPAEPLDAVAGFYGARMGTVRSLIVLGSTSAYGPGGDRVGTVDEDVPPDRSIARVQGEEWLRERGATVLRLAGIFGPGREPADWLRRGRIRDGAKIVNLIHVHDVVAVIARLIDRPAPGALFNVANGEPLAWRDLAARLRRSGRIPADAELPGDGREPWGKRIDNRRLRALLPGHVFRRP